jgi:hypothetical protein
VYSEETQLNPISKLIAALKQRAASFKARNSVAVAEADRAISRIVAVLGLTAFVANNKAAAGIEDIFEIILAIAITGVGYPIALGFIFTANLTGWSPQMKTLWQVGMPSLMTLLVVWALFVLVKRKD